MADENAVLMYKGRPLMRKDNLVYYGSMADSHIVMLQVLESKKMGDMDVATRVSVQLQLTDPAAKSRDRIVKKSEKDGFYTALDLGCVWLERALAGKYPASFSAAEVSPIPAAYLRRRTSMNLTRRILTTVLATVLAVSALIIPASASESILYGIGFVNTEGLRLRSEASITSAVVDTAHKNDCVVLTAKSGDWYKVSYNLQEGYMHASYLTASTCENAELGYGTITGTGVNLRSGPSTAHRISAVSAQGDRCYIIGLNKGWFKVIYKDKICYIRSDFVKLTEFPYENRDDPQILPAWCFHRHFPARFLCFRRAGNCQRKSDSGGGEEISGLSLCSRRRFSPRF